MRSGWMHCDNGEGQERFAPKTTMEAVTGLQETLSKYESHLENKANPHQVTAAQVGAATPAQVKTAARAARAWSRTDNGEFTNPVNQRGARSWTNGDGYCIDRWKYYADGGATVSLGSGGLTLTPTASGICQIYQRMEHYDSMAGKVYTVAVGVGGVWDCATFVMGSEAEGKELASGLTVYSIEGYDVMIRNGAGNSAVTIEKAALYEGAYTLDTLPPYVPKGYAAELMECKRYCRVIDWSSERHAGLFGAATSGSTMVYAVLPIDVPMRVTPSLSSTAGTNFRLYGGDGSFNPTAVNVLYASINDIGLTFTCTAVWGRVYVIYPATATPIVLSADL